MSFCNLEVEGKKEYIYIYTYERIELSVYTYKILKTYPIIVLYFLELGKGRRNITLYFNVNRNF